ncbi:MAG: hypothetical protein COW88_03195 [Candidatus Lloydbacteria bacterium CG22_combo_CG10-13_8_21_14_all_47_15]|uniref:Enoyl-CoA hydratase n=1 Tax=Candidatus Lloydbacteria bacterium CG22_combo_CG10-13_8_21_14_all_47_15 TaxID=1974635 RepID=A0A2H0CUF9_9BACT|nr:MAG: hypothetical protein COW88_03195 [Candidatus Lloydbacteria bacterium CG22_combo_CG10-13_8_21_14_all_47_15]
MLTLEWQDRQKIGILRMQDKVNVLTVDLRDKIREIFEQHIYINPQYRHMKALVITGMSGAGTQKTFSAGASLFEIREAISRLMEENESPIRTFLSGGHEFMKMFYSHSLRMRTFATFAIIGGAGAFGGGLELALSCNRCIGIRGSTVSFPEAFFGMLPGWGGTIRTFNKVSYAHYINLIEHSARVSVEEAFNMNLLDDIFDSEDAAIEYIASLDADKMERITREARVCHPVDIDQEIKNFIHRVKLVGIQNVIANITAFLKKKEG